jgi:hypothetical protein
MKEAYAWWTREFIEGLKAEIHLPPDQTSPRTILIFASAARRDRPRTGDQLYFELPAGIEQISSFNTETHLFLFDTLPRDSRRALQAASSADAQYTCTTLGVENRQGNREVDASWRIEGTRRPILTSVPGGRYRPNTPVGMQQVRVEVERAGIDSFDYLFEREKRGWDPEFSRDEELYPGINLTHDANSADALGSDIGRRGWRLVKGLVPRFGLAPERDEEALRLAAPESGSFILVSRRRRRKDQDLQQEIDF